MRKLLLLIVFFSLSAFLVAQNELRTTSSNVNLRTNPWIDHNVICVIPKSTLLTINQSSQTSTEWIKVNYNGKIGYVYSKYLVSPEFKSSINNNYELSKKADKVNYYINSKGEKVQSPTFYKTAPAGATAECRDGTYSFSRNRRGTCSHHGGVKRWL
jgi:uncharacterized protein YgiM (DUF1202 family)